MRMSKESKRGKEEKERKLKTFENEKFSIVYLVNLCFTGILTTSCFHCLCVILAPRYWQFYVFIVFKMTVSLNLLYFVSSFFEFLTIIKMGIINDLCIPHFSIIFYFVTKILAISCYHCLQMMM